MKIIIILFRRSKWHHIFDYSKIVTSNKIFTSYILHKNHEKIYKILIIYDGMLNKMLLMERETVL